MKFRMQVGCLAMAMACATLTACDTKGSAQLKAALTLQRRIAAIAGQANGAAPAVIDPDTRLDGARAGPGLRLTVMYTLVNAESKGVDSATSEPELTPTIKEHAAHQVTRAAELTKSTHRPPFARRVRVNTKPALETDDTPKEESPRDAGSPESMLNQPAVAVSRRE